MKKMTVLICMFVLSFGLPAQETQTSSLEDVGRKTQALESDILKLKKLKISGYIQSQYQYGEKEATLNVGTANSDSEKSFNRVGIRRGRIKFTYEEGIASGVFQIDLTEKGVDIKDAYLNVKAPWLKSVQFRTGVFDRPFGYEISYSSSRRESPERSAIFRTLFPQERDLGAMFILQAPQSSPWNVLKLEAGLFAGNGIKQETDNRKDFIGHLSGNKTIGDNMNVGLGASYYNGGVYQGSENVYTMKDKGFVIDNNSSNKGKFAKREYFGLDAQYSLITSLGITQLRGEYLFGQQPGTAGSSKSPNASTLPASDTYVRDFNGWYVMLVQDIGRLPFSAVLKYDSYDPNTKVKGDEIGQNGTSQTDLAKNTFGLGGIWKMNENLLLQVFYEINKNEKSNNVTGMNSDLEDNVFTTRLQYKF
ncbi:MAG: hypothetical protein LBH12_01485 [Dysgonamonadaceae bacterium]|jgi:phosphate-selective porin|nr:hypothetical protein [Dysgonamonadaceae bacterium]